MLDRIVTQKIEEVQQTKRNLPLSRLKERVSMRKERIDFSGALSGDGVKVIAEVKKASPSRGVLRPDFSPVELARTYADCGAAAISVLTETKYFQGSIEHLAEIRKQSRLPLLRKDFIFDSYQVYESAANGADALLLIVAILEQQQLQELLNLSHSLGLGCLVEVHNREEIEKALLAGAEIIGINNRDLNTFTVDIDTTRQLRPFVPNGCIVVSESGIRSRDDVRRLMEWGVNAALVGEALVTAGDIQSCLKELVL